MNTLNDGDYELVISPKKPQEMGRNYFEGDNEGSSSSSSLPLPPPPPPPAEPLEEIATPKIISKRERVRNFLGFGLKKVADPVEKERVSEASSNSYGSEKDNDQRVKTKSVQNAEALDEVMAAFTGLGLRLSENGCDQDYEHKHIIPGGGVNEPVDADAAIGIPSRKRGLKAAGREFLGNALSTLASPLSFASGLWSRSGSKTKTAAELEEEHRAAHAAEQEAELQRMMARSQRYQRRIISTTRALDKAKEQLLQTTQWKMRALVAQDEVLGWKGALCDQLQRVLEKSNHERSQRLHYITNTYFF